MEHVSCKYDNTDRHNSSVSEGNSLITEFAFFHTSVILLDIGKILLKVQFVRYGHICSFRSWKKNEHDQTNLQYNTVLKVFLQIIAEISIEGSTPTASLGQFHLIIPLVMSEGDSSILKQENGTCPVYIKKHLALGL